MSKTIDDIKNDIKNYITSNGRQEITGQILQQILLEMIEKVEEDNSPVFIINPDVTTWGEVEQAYANKKLVYYKNAICTVFTVDEAEQYAVFYGIDGDDDKDPYIRMYIARDISLSDTVPSNISNEQIGFLDRINIASRDEIDSLFDTELSGGSSSGN